MRSNLSETLLCSKSVRKVDCEPGFTCFWQGGGLQWVGLQAGRQLCQHPDRRHPGSSIFKMTVAQFAVWVHKTVAAKHGRPKLFLSSREREKTGLKGLKT